jgi:ribosomal protein S27E
MFSLKKEKNTDPLNIVCPACTEENALEYGNHISCNKCEKTFAGHTYKKFKKPLLSVKAALFIGAVGAYKLDKEFLEPKRYSTGAIVEIVSFCTNSDTIFRKASQRVSAHACICALDETMKEVPEAELSSNAKLFKSTFISNLQQCR